MPDQPIPNDDDLAETIDMDLVLVEDNDMDPSPVVSAQPLPTESDAREPTVWVSGRSGSEQLPVEASAQTIILTPEESLGRVIAFLEGLRAQLIQRRQRKGVPDLVLDPVHREMYFDGLGLSDEELSYAGAAATKFSHPEDVGALADYLRDIQILRFQRTQIMRELDPATQRDDRGRPMPRHEDFGLSEGQRQRLLLLFERAAHLESIPNDALHLLLQRSAEFCVEISSHLASSMNPFRCYSAPYVVPNYAVSAVHVVEGTGYEINIPDCDAEILWNVPRSQHVPTEGARVLLFQMARNASPADVEDRYRKLGLRPLDLWELLAFNVKNGDLLKHRPNTTYWIVEGDWRFAACYTHGEGYGEPQVAVKRPVLRDGFILGWNFAGIPLEA